MGKTYRNSRSDWNDYHYQDDRSPSIRNKKLKSKNKRSLRKSQQQFEQESYSNERAQHR